MIVDLLIVVRCDALTGIWNYGLTWKRKGKGGIESELGDLEGLSVTCMSVRSSHVAAIAFCYCRYPLVHDVCMHVRYLHDTTLNTMVKEVHNLNQ